jgi:ribosomal protein L40E
MEEGKKKMIMIGIIVACFVAAGIIFFATRSRGPGGGIEDIKRGQAMYWMKCRNPECENTWQMDMKDYFEYIEKHRVGMTVPGVLCPKCNKETGYRAEKCENCGFIFERGSVPGDVPDRCPKCGHSAMEDLRKRARGEAPQPAATTEEKE